MNRPNLKFAMRLSTLPYCLFAAAALTLTACAVTPPYTLKPDEKVASLQMITSSEVTMCRNSVFYKVPAPQDKTEARIPSGERISVGTYMQYGGYNVTYSCYPFVSFVPKEGEKYVLHNFVKGDQCFIEVAGLDGASPTGVKLEESARPRHCYKDK
nr:hypothetical protein [uncultured Rhodoferax sp.]